MSLLEINSTRVLGLRMEATRSSRKPKKSCKKIDLGGAISPSDPLGAFDEVAADPTQFVFYAGPLRL